jgi:hypothetical protein
MILIIPTVQANKDKKAAAIDSKGARPKVKFMAVP